MHERWELSAERLREIEAVIQDTALPLDMRAAARLKLFLECERVCAGTREAIPIWRTLISFPDIYAPGEREALTQGKFVHEQGRVFNLCSDWAGVLNEGLLVRRERATEAARICADAVIAYADRYELKPLSRAVRFGARGFKEALMLFRLLHFCLWAANSYHNTVGRFDQYMYPFYKRDTESGALTQDEALALTREFFLSFNRDSDLYIGMQKGDNGQSLMLGGVDSNGECAVNELTYIALRASLLNRRIDPKINLRVDKNTPLELYELATELTKQGLGFPQYANDDVVIPALTRWGYSLEHARDYSVAACWEFIVPGVARDIPNIAAISHAGIAREAIYAALPGAEQFNDVFDEYARRVRLAADDIERSVKPIYIEPSPYQTLLMSDVTQDVSEGAEYMNYGVHGTGIATAVDQLAAVKALVFDKREVDARELISALDANFEGAGRLRRVLREQAPKLGRDAECEQLLERVLDVFAGALEGRRNEFGGVFRAGTGSAMYYLWHARELGATADGRMAGEALSANFSPSLILTDAGPLSVVSAMARKNLSSVCNGGPLTLEMHDSVLARPEGARKVAMLVKNFITLGGHQLQINAVDPDTLRDAREHPENYPNLIVRVWGWSGHFVKLDREYQDQIIMRTAYAK